MRDKLITAVPIFVAIVWLTAICFGYIQGTATENWMPVDGTVVSMDYARTWGGQESDSGGRIPNYRANIRYRYQVDGTSYIGRNYSLDYFGRPVQMTGSMHWMRDYEKVDVKYAPGTELTVYHKPDSPQYALLKTGYGANIFMFIGFGILAMATPLLRRFKTIFNR